jgi:hypothetical protein
MVPVERIELPTFGLQNRCSTAELNRQTFRFRQCNRRLKSFGAGVPAIDIDGAGAPSNTRVIWSGLQLAEIARKPCAKPSPDASFVAGIRSVGEKRNGEQAAVDCCICLIGGFCLRTDRGPGCGSGILQTICSGSAQSGAWRISQSALRRRPARCALVVGFGSPLRMVSRGVLWRRRRRAGCTHAIFARLHWPLI